MGPKYNTENLEFLNSKIFRILSKTNLPIKINKKLKELYNLTNRKFIAYIFRKLALRFIVLMLIFWLPPFYGIVSTHDNLN